MKIQIIIVCVILSETFGDGDEESKILDKTKYITLQRNSEDANNYTERTTELNETLTSNTIDIVDNDKLLSTIEALESQNACLFHDTVNITSGTMYSNKSIEFEGVMYPPEFYAYYNYNYNNNIPYNVTKHTRGCVCLIKNCISLCCARGESFFSSTGFCEIDPEYTNFNSTSVEEKLYKDFGIIYRNLCDRGSFLQKDKWELNSDGQIIIDDAEQNIVNRSNYCLTKYYTNDTEDEEEHHILPYICYVGENDLKFVLLPIGKFIL